jgi:hypothetical protein
MQTNPKIWDRKILRKINCPMKGQNGWRIRTNDEPQVTYRKPNTVTTKKKARRLEWAGHVVRMSDDVTKSTSGENRWKKKNRKIKNKGEGKTFDSRSV